MKTIWKEHGFRFLLSVLLSSGLILTCLNALDLSPDIAPLTGIILLFSAFLELISLNRKTMIAGTVLASAATLFWLFAAGGLAASHDLLRAAELHFSGVAFALPLVASGFSLFVAVGGTLLGFLCTRKSAGSIPAGLLCMLALVTVWWMDRFPLVWYLLPAFIATSMMMVMDIHAEISPFRVLPWLAAAVLLAMLVTPSSGIVSPSLKERASQIRQRIMDRLFFTNPRDVFSLQSEGFYPEGSGQLGGKVSLSDHPVMQVSSPRDVYLRGVILNEYDGRAWRNTLGGRRYLWESSSSRKNRLRLYDQDLPGDGLAYSLTEPMSVSVRMLSGSTSTLFVPQRIRELRVGGELVPYFSNSSELFITRNLQAGDTWSVSAPLFLAGDPGLGILVEAASYSEDDAWDSIAETFTALPSHLEEPVWQMAADVTSSHVSSYEKAYALQTFLSRSYRYTLDVEPQPSNLDFVTNFLFNTGEGYCTYFASAMTVLCRMAGLPARYVEGYYAHPNAQGEALVTGLDAHAWTEVYFRGFGWITFDATPRRESSDGEKNPSNRSENSEESPSPSPNPSGGSPTPTPVPASVFSSPPASETDASGEDPSGRDSLSFWPFCLLALLLLLLLFRWLRTSPALMEKRAPDAGTRFEIWLLETADRLRARNLPRLPGETPMSYTRRLDASEDLPVGLSSLGECVSLLRYGNRVPDENDLLLVRETALALRREQQPSARFRYALRRLFARHGRRSIGSTLFPKAEKPE